MNSKRNDLRQKHGQTDPWDILPLDLQVNAKDDPKALLRKQRMALGQIMDILSQAQDIVDGVQDAYGEPYQGPDAGEPDPQTVEAALRVLPVHLTALAGMEKLLKPRLDAVADSVSSLAMLEQVGPAVSPPRRNQSASYTDAFSIGRRSLVDEAQRTLATYAKVLLEATTPSSSKRANPPTR